MVFVYSEFKSSQYYLYSTTAHADKSALHNMEKGIKPT